MKKIGLILTLCLLVGTVFSQRIDSSFVFSGNSHNYSLYIPTNYNPAVPNKMILGFHPLNVGVWNSITWCDTLVDMAEANNLIVVCPDGGTNGVVDDMADTLFTTALLDSMEVWYNIDTDKVYAIGFSVGGRATYTYSLSNSNRIKGFIPIGAAINGTNEVNSTLQANAACKPVYLIHGGNDNPNVRYWPVRGALVTAGAHVNSVLMPGIGHTMNFPNADSIMSWAYQWVDSLNCAPVTADAGANDSICIGETITIGGDPVGIGGKCPYTYSWFPATSLNNSTIANPDATPTTSTQYLVTVTDADGNTSTDITVVVVNPPPTLTTSSNTTICAGESTQLSVGGAESYFWSPALGLSCVLCPFPTASPTTTTTYAVLGADTNGCQSSESVIIFVNPTPVLTTSSDTSICDGDTIGISVTGAQSYSWSPTTDMNNPSAASPLIYPSTNTDFWVVATDSNNCVDSAMIAVTVLPSPVVTITGDDAICLGDSIQLDATGGMGYSWSPAVGLSSSTIANPIAYPDSTMVYSVAVSNLENCTTSASVEIEVLPVPVAGFLAQLQGLTVDFVDLSSGETSWSWDFGDGQTSTVQNPTHTYAPGVYTACLTVTNDEGCEHTACQPVEAVDVGIGEANDNGQLTIYPNPATDIISLELANQPSGKVAVILMDIRGKQISKNYHQSQIMQLDLSALEAGVYYVQIVLEDAASGQASSTISRKIIKQ